MDEGERENFVIETGFLSWLKQMGKSIELPEVFNLSSATKLEDF
jgi:hypothetical protein